MKKILFLALVVVCYNILSLESYYNYIIKTERRKIYEAIEERNSPDYTIREGEYSYLGKPIEQLHKELDRYLTRKYLLRPALAGLLAGAIIVKLACK